MKQFCRRIFLSLAALSPGVASLTMQEMALSFAVALIGLTGAISMAIAVFAVSPKVNEALSELESPNTEYPSLLTLAALTRLQEQDIDLMSARAHLTSLITPAIGQKGFVTTNDQIAMILSQVMAQWRVTDPMQLSDDQARELWFIERLMRATPAEAGALAKSFTTPTAMLAMRDRVADGTVG